LSNGEFLVQLSGVPGTTRAEQRNYIEGLLHNAGLDQSSGQQHTYSVADHMGVDGLVLLHTPVDVDASQDVDVVNVTQDLSVLPGFQYAEAFDEHADPSTRRSLFPEHDTGEDNEKIPESELVPD